MNRLPLLLLCLLPALPSLPAAAALYAAAGKADITPDVAHETVWLAGYGPMGRRARGVHDPIYVRELLVSDGKKTVAIAAVDSIGLFREDVLEMRRELGWLGGDKYLFVSATHDHSGPDTEGLWGRFPGVSGVDPAYRRRLIGAVAKLTRDLTSELKEAELRAGRAEVDPRGLCKDTRDPVVIDPELEAFQLRSKEGPVIGTVVRWSCHAEVLGSDNHQLTADFPGPLCAKIEKEAGGTCVFQNGVIGGLLSPEVEHGGGPERAFAETARVGETVAAKALAALKPAPWRAAAAVSFDSLVVRVPVENSRYLLFLPNLTFGHAIMDKDGRPLPRWRRYWLPLRHLLLFPLPERLLPWVETELSRVRVGPVDILGIPAELFPELAIGGYDGRYRFGHPVVQPTNPNPPDLAKAPRGPYLREKLGSRHGLLVGLANDELGYIVPDYDFQVARSRVMAPRPPGTHYEETNSIGPSATQILLRGYDELLSR